MAGAFTFGMEEEYFLVDAETKVVARDVPAEFFAEAKKASEGRISTEFLQPQIEVISSPHALRSSGPDSAHASSPCIRVKRATSRTNRLRCVECQPPEARRRCIDTSTNSSAANRSTIG